MTNMKIRATALGVTLALALIGAQSSVAQPGSGFENRDYAQSRSQQNPGSISQTRQQAIQTCVAQAQRQAPGDTHEGQRQRGGIYLSCMHSKGQRP
jgi:hypothetical protein